MRGELLWHEHGEFLSVHYEVGGHSHFSKGIAWKSVSPKLLCSHIFSCLFSFLCHLDTQGCSGLRSSQDVQWEGVEEGGVRPWLPQNIDISVLFILGARTIFLKNAARLKCSIFFFPVWLSCSVSEVKACVGGQSWVLQYDPVWWHS